MKHLKTILLIMAFSFMSSFFSLPASDIDYSIESFYSEIEVSRSGRYSISESVTMFFNSPAHGFFRSLPLTYQSLEFPFETKIVDITDIHTNETMTVSVESGTLVLRIGDVNRLISGRKKFTYSYLYDIGIQEDEKAEEFHYNLVGDGWEVPLEQFEFKIMFPDQIHRESVDLIRRLNEKFTTEKLWWELSDDGKTIKGHSGMLSPGEMVVIRVQLSEDDLSCED